MSQYQAVAFWRPILRSGTHNGEVIDSSLLKAVADNFTRSGLRPMIRRGHEASSSQPAAGDVLAVRLNGDTLEAELDPTPDLVEDVRAGRYRSLSPGFRKTEKGWALDHVAVLGAAHPAWKGQPVLQFSEIGPAEPMFFAESLAALLNRMIDEMATEERPRAEIVNDMAEAGGIEPGTVEQILRGEIEQPPEERLRAFAKILKADAQSLMTAAGMEEPMNMTELRTTLQEFKDSIVGAIKALLPSQKADGTPGKTFAEQWAEAKTDLERQFTERLTALERRLTATAQQLTLAEKDKRRHEILAFVEKRRKRLPPAMVQAGLVEFMESLSDTEITFSEGGKQIKLSQRAQFEALLDQIPENLLFGEFIKPEDLDVHGKALTDDRKAQLRAYAGLPDKRSAAA
jgi:transcriptional regulator with XRE-family HTH domain